MWDERRKHNFCPHAHQQEIGNILETEQGFSRRMKTTVLKVSESTRTTVTSERSVIMGEHENEILVVFCFEQND